MTNHFPDIKNADVIMCLGSNAAENHPIAFKWVTNAMLDGSKGTAEYPNGAKLIVVDPRYTRTASKASVVNGVQLYSEIRSGTDIAFMLGMMKWAIDNGRINWQYVRDCTNASFLLDPHFKTCRQSNPRYGEGNVLEGNFTGIFSGLVDDPRRHKKYKYNKGSTLTNPGYWSYQYVTPIPSPPAAKQPKVDRTIPGDPPGPSKYWDTVPPSGSPNADSVWAKFIEHLSDYTVARVCSITGADPATLRQIYDVYTSTCAANKSATILYAMGTTQHTYGSQNVRADAIIQLLLGNIGVAGGGVNALRGESNVQGSTDQALLWNNIPGYMAIPTNTPTFINRTAYKDYYKNGNQPQDPVPGGPLSGNPESKAWLQQYPKYIDSLLQAWWPKEHTLDANLDNAYNYLPKAHADYWYTHT
jgi:formate dehydrogenase major subunit